MAEKWTADEKWVSVEFDSIEERDAWIEEHYPERVCTATPGLYRVKGGSVGVFCLQVTLYPGKPSRPAYQHRGRRG